MRISQEAKDLSASIPKLILDLEQASSIENQRSALANLTRASSLLEDYIQGWERFQDMLDGKLVGNRPSAMIVDDEDPQRCLAPHPLLTYHGSPIMCSLPQHSADFKHKAIVDVMNGPDADEEEYEW